jgi:hypothetical protein
MNGLDVVSLDELAERCRSLDIHTRSRGSWSLLMQVDGVGHLIRLHESNLAQLLRRALDVSGESLAAVLEDEANELARMLLAATSALARVRGEPWPADGTEGLDAWLTARGVRGLL